MTEDNFINYNGINIYYMDFSEIKDKKEIHRKIDEFKKYISSQPEKSVYALTNLENMFFNSSINKSFNEFVKFNEKYIKKSAIIGIDGLIKVMFNGLLKITKRDLHPFDTLEEAKNYLSN